jgi:hypothetical protein
MATLLENEHALRDVVADLHTVATGTAPSTFTVKQLAAKLQNGSLTFERYIESLTNRSGFAQTIAPRIVLGLANLEPGSMPVWALNQEEPSDGGEPIYYLSEPCEPDQAVSVEPWWNPDSRVKVCPSSYKPDIRRDPSNGKSCLRRVFGRYGQCGCGPNLGYCARDSEHQREILASMHQEGLDTIARIVQEDRPLREVYTANETVRDRNAEYIYHRSRLAAGEIEQLPDLSEWAVEGQYAARHEAYPGQHAGLLTAPMLVYMADAARPRMRLFYTLAWCASPSSQRVDGDAVLSLEDSDLRLIAEDSDSWQHLARKDGCTDCHARMDFGMQFFHEFPSMYEQIGPVSSLRRNGTGELYGRDIQDPRGGNQLNPAGFAELLVSQPEYEMCMTKRITEHVFGPSVPPVARRAALAAFRKSERMKPAMKAALETWVAHQAQALTARTSTEQPALPQSSPSLAIGSKESKSDATVTIADGLGDSLQTHCGGCHFSGHEARVDLQTDELSRSVALEALHRLSFHSMPPPEFPHRLDGHERHAMAKKLAEHLFSGADLAVALDFYLGGLTPEPVLHVREGINRARAAAGVGAASTDNWLVQDTLEPQFGRASPAYVLQIASAALEGCREKYEPNSEQLRRCLVRATRPEVGLRAPQAR